MIMIDSYFDRVYNRDLSDLMTKPKSKPGKSWKYEYRYKGTDDTQELEVKGKVDTYAMIQADKDSTDINLLIKRFTAGEIDILDRYEVFYDDATAYPRNLLEAMQVKSRVDEFFMSLPPDEREKYDHDVFKFIQNLDKVLDQKDKETVSSVESEVKSDAIEQE